MKSWTNKLMLTVILSCAAESLNAHAQITNTPTPTHAHIINTPTRTHTHPPRPYQPGTPAVPTQPQTPATKPTARRLRTAAIGASELLRKMLDDDSAQLALLLREVLRTELSGCSLLLAMDPTYLSSPILTHILTLPNPTQVVVMDDSDNLIRADWGGGSLCRGHLFLLSHPQTFLTFANTHLRQWEYYGKHVIVGLSEGELEALTRTKKGRKTQHIVGIVKTDTPGEWTIYINQLYSNQQLREVSRWRQSGFTPQAILFPDKISNLQGATLNFSYNPVLVLKRMLEIEQSGGPPVVTFEFPPGTIFRRDVNGGLNPYGGDVELIRAFARASNFTPNFIEVPPGEVWGERLDNGTWTGIIGMLGRGTGDLGIANIFITSLMGRRDHQHFSSPYHRSVNCVILRVPPPVPRWMAPLWPFRYDTWIALVLTLLITGPLLYYLAIYSAKNLGEKSYLPTLSSGYLHVAGMHLQQSMSVQANTNSSRVAMILVGLGAMVLGVAYSCNLTAFLTITRQPRTIDTFRDLQASGLTVIGLGPIFGNLMKQSENKYLRELYHQFIPLQANPEKWVREGRAGYITSDHNSLYTVETMNAEHHTPIVRTMKECTWPFSVGVGIQSMSPLKARLDRVVDRTVEAGLVHHWFREAIRIAAAERRQLSSGGRGAGGGEEGVDDEGEAVDTRVVPLNTDHVQGIFYILGLSYLATALIFLAELAIFHHRRAKDLSASTSAG